MKSLVLKTIEFTVAPLRTFTIDDVREDTLPVDEIMKKSSTDKKTDKNEENPKKLFKYLCLQWKFS